MRRFVSVRRLVAALLATVTAILVGSDLAALHRHARELGPERTVVVATRDLALGRSIRSEDLDVHRTRAALVPHDAFTSADDVADRVVLVPVLAGAPITARAVTPVGRHGLDGVVPVGSRALRVNPIGAPDVEPGQLVDVFAAFPDSPGTSIAAHAALVIRVDDRAESIDGTASAVTLLVDTADAGRVADAVAGGQVVLALTPPEEAEAALPSP
jgi:Flp pilus assembly protein CpaB